MTAATVEGDRGRNTQFGKPFVVWFRIYESWSSPITERQPFSEAERTRFHNMLKLAAESPFAGERENALAAAKRLATGHGMTLEEAAAAGADAVHVRPRRPAADPDTIRRQARHAAGGASFASQRAARTVHDLESWHRFEKERHEAAVREARKRGLDGDQRRRETPPRPFRTKGGGRDPQSHARVLIRETSLPLSEICQLTGLNIYQVVGLKLRMRPAAAGG